MDARAACRSIVVATFATFAAICANASFTKEAVSEHRFQLSGSGSLALDAPVLQNETTRLKAALSPRNAAIGRRAIQSGSGFSLDAALTTSSLVCYSDTIFRDDFDGDGF